MREAFLHKNKKTTFSFKDFLYICTLKNYKYGKI